MRRAVLAIFWPFAAPLDKSASPVENRLWWRLTCVLLLIPLTALWHHGVFYRPRCMLNDFGPEYTPDVIADWLYRDPSLPWAIVCAAFVYLVGLRFRFVQFLVAPFFLAFLPFSLWIWDIPYSGRWICHHGHDKRPFPGLGMVIRTRYLYMLGAMLELLGLAWLATAWLLSRRSPIPAEA